MGRELRRKQAKKEGKSLEKENLIEEKQFKKLIINILIILFIFAIIYILSALFLTKELNWFNTIENEKTESQKINNEILASAIFKQPEEQYYVYFYEFDAKNNAITEIVNAKILNEKVYKVNTSSAMNSNYIAKVGNKKAKTLKELKIIPQTLIKISNGIIIEYYEKNEIIDKLS